MIIKVSKTLRVYFLYKPSLKARRSMQRAVLQRQPGAPPFAG